MSSDQSSQLPKLPANKPSGDKPVPLPPDYAEPTPVAPEKKYGLWGLLILMLIIIKLFGPVGGLVIFGCYYLLKFLQPKLETWGAFAACGVISAVVAIGLAVYMFNRAPSLKPTVPASSSTIHDNVGDTAVEPVSTPASAQPNLGASNMPTDSANTVGGNAEDLPQSLTTGPNGLVAISNDPKAMTAFSNVVMPSLEPIQAFVEPLDNDRLGVGNTSFVARVAIVSRYRDPKLQYITSTQFQQMVSQLRLMWRKTDMKSLIHDANSQIQRNSAKATWLKNASVDNVAKGSILFDEENCIAMTVRGSIKEEADHQGVNGVSGLYRIDGKLFVVSVYANSSVKDTTWLYSHGVKWLHGLCVGP